MTPTYAERRHARDSRMRLHSFHDQRFSADEHGFARQETMFIIGNKAFFLAVKRAVDAAGGFHIVGAFRMEDLATRLRRSTLLGQTPTVAVIHEPPGERAQADDAAHRLLESYPGCGIVLISGDELEAETERRMAVHDFNAIVMPESAVKNPKSLARGMHAAIAETGGAEMVS